ncbi:ribosomal subunit interface protein [Chromatiales bacterium (ex Bugula neritina AB1)]|nr:ribosomal subunit interface protein [Chromatiales bacterium (ex Bugula neritina AB1)]
MNLIVTGHHIDVTDSLRHYVTSKMDRLERHSDEVMDIHVILTVEKQRQKAEATVNVKGAQLFADTIEADMYAAIDLLTDKLDRQLIKHKEKLKDHHRKDKDKINTDIINTDIIEE